MHTDDPGAALRAGTAIGVLERVEIANMHLQTAQREERLSHRDPTIGRTTAVVAVVTGEGNRRLFESMGATGIVDGGETMNPSTEELLRAIERTARREVVVLANNDNVVLAARQAARLARCPVHVVPSSSLQAGLGAMLAYDALSGRRGERGGDGGRGRPAIATGAVTVASRAVSVDGLQVERGAYLGLVDGEPVAGGTSFDAVASLGRRPPARRAARRPDAASPAQDEPELGPLLARVAERHPELELEVHPGGQPHYPLLALRRVKS